MNKEKSGIYLLFYYARDIAKKRVFGKGCFFFLKSLMFPFAPKICCFELRLRHYLLSLNVNEILATAADNHPVKLTNKRRNRTFFADYNGFWQEIGGVLNVDGNFTLLEALPERKLEDVPSKKKKDWIARHNYMKEMTEMTKVSFAKIKP